MKLIKFQKIIIDLRGEQVILDFELAKLYGTETKRLKQAVRRNIDRFPDDFMFELTKSEWDYLRSQFVSSSHHGGTRHAPFAFTEQGVAMLSSVLKSQKAIEVNIAIMRTFVDLRKYILANQSLKIRLDNLEKKLNTKFKNIYELLNYLLKGNDQNNNPQKDVK